MIHLLVFAVVAATASPSPEQLFAQQHEAAGGAAWDRIGEIVERGTYAGSGLTGPYVSYVDPKTGWSKVQIALAGAIAGQGYDAKGAWSQQGTLVQPVEDAAAAGAARTGAYVARNGWWQPQSDPATFEVLGVKEERGKSYDVVRVTPKGGIPVDVWLDSANHLLAKTVMTDASNVTTTTTYGDYRQTQGVLYPFSTTSGTGNPKFDQRTTVASVQLLGSPIAADLSRPENQRTGTIAGGTSTTVPFDFNDPQRGHIVIQVRVNGSRPLHVIFDTGGSNIVTPKVAKELGLHGAGAIAAGGAGEQQISVQLVNGASLRVGEATMTDQQFGIIDLPPSLVASSPKYPIDGIVGYEILKNYVVSVDYVHHTLTLTDPAAFVPQPGAAAITFQSATIPVVQAKIDGVEGAFMVDTGNGYYNTVSQDFVAAHSLENLKGTVLVQSSGNIGGAIRTPLARPSSFELGPFHLARPVFAVSSTSKGALAGTAFAGNIGEPILTRFDVAFDYGKSTIYLKPNANYSKPLTGTLDGMSLYEPNPGDVRVSYVNANSPAAAAGLRAGDRLLSVDGVSLATIGKERIAQLEREKSALVIVYQRAGTKTTTTLRPHEMVP